MHKNVLLQLLYLNMPSVHGQEPNFIFEILVVPYLDSLWKFLALNTILEPKCLEMKNTLA